jgi:hypothetical protein
VAYFLPPGLLVGNLQDLLYGILLLIGGHTLLLSFDLLLVSSHPLLPFNDPLGELFLAFLAPLQQNLPGREGLSLGVQILLNES